MNDMSKLDHTKKAPITTSQRSLPITQTSIDAILSSDYASAVTTFRRNRWDVSANPELQKILDSMDENTRLVFACN